MSLKAKGFDVEASARRVWGTYRREPVDRRVVGDRNSGMQRRGAGGALRRWTWHQTSERFPGWMGAAPRQRGSSEAWPLMQPSRGIASTSGGISRP